MKTNAVKELPPLTTLSWWGELTANVQQVVEAEDKALVEDILLAGKSQAGIGQHLLNLKKALKGRFEKYVSQRFQFTVRTAYRYIDDYERNNKLLPAPVLRMAMAKGYNLSRDTQKLQAVVKKMPPPKTDDPVKVENWLKDAKKASRGLKLVSLNGNEPEPEDQESIQKQCYRFMVLRLKLLPNKRSQIKCLEAVAGMLYKELGVDEVRSIHPIEIPEDFPAVVGRPTKITASA